MARATEPVPSPPPPGERLTWREICARYPDQWVVLVDLEFTDTMYSEVRSAVVAGHGGDEASFDMAAPHLMRYQEIAHLHTGQPDPSTWWGGEVAPCPSPA